MKKEGLKFYVNGQVPESPKHAKEIRMRVAKQLDKKVRENPDYIKNMVQSDEEHPYINFY